MNRPKYKPTGPKVAMSRVSISMPPARGAIALFSLAKMDGGRSFACELLALFTSTFSGSGSIVSYFSNQEKQCLRGL